MKYKGSQWLRALLLYGCFALRVAGAMAGNVAGKGIALTEQQITAGYQGRSRHYCIKHYIERIFPNLFVHDSIL